MTAPPRHRPPVREQTPSRPSARLPFADRLAHFVLDALGWLALFGCGFLLGVAVLAAYLAQSGALG